MGNACNCNNGDKNLHDLQPEEPNNSKINNSESAALAEEGATGGQHTNRQLPAPMTQAVKSISNKTNKERVSKNAVDVYVDKGAAGTSVEQRFKDKNLLKPVETSKNLGSMLPVEPVNNNNPSSQYQQFQGVQPSCLEESKQQLGGGGVNQSQPFAPNIPMVSPQHQAAGSTQLQNAAMPMTPQQPPTPLPSAPPVLLVNQQLSPVHQHDADPAVPLKQLCSLGIQTSVKQLPPPTAVEEQKQSSAQQQMIEKKDTQNAPMSPNDSLAKLTGNTLFEKLGGHEGVKQLVDKVFTRIADDPQLSCLYQGSTPERPIDMGMLKDKYRFYFTYLMGGVEHWIGRPMEEVHRCLKINDKVFDAFNSHCIASLKEMRRLKVDGLKEMIRLLQNLRDHIVMKEEGSQGQPTGLDKQSQKMLPQQQAQPVEVAVEVQKQPEAPKSLSEEMGGLESLKKVASKAMELARQDQTLSEYFKHVDSCRHDTKLGHYFAYATGGMIQDWVGCPLSTAHAGHFIPEVHFNLFIDCVKKALLQNGIPESTHLKFIGILIDAKPSIVIPSQQNFTLWQKLNYNGRFDSIVNKFVDKVANDEGFKEYVEKNKMMRHIIYTIVTSYFSQNGKQNDEDMQTFGMRLTIEQFNRSQCLFKESCLQSNLNSVIVEEALQLYANLEKVLVTEEVIVKAEEQIQTEVQEEKVPVIVEHAEIGIQAQRTASIQNINAQEQIQQDQQVILERAASPQEQIAVATDEQQEVNANDESLEVRGPSEVLARQNIVQPCKYESLSKDASEAAISTEGYRRKPSQISGADQAAIQAVVVNNAQEDPASTVNNGPPIETNRMDNLATQLEQLMEESEAAQESRVSPTKQSARNISPSKYPPMKRIEVELKYNLKTLVNGQLLFEGELLRHVERQKSKLARWLVLRNEALFVYKDMLNARSFPERPVQCIPLAEIQSVKPKEESRGGKRPAQAFFELDINLKDQYGTIAASIGQLFTDYTLQVLNSGANESRLNASRIGYQPTSKHQAPGFSECVLTFLSPQKKDIAAWLKLLQSKVNVAKNLTRAVANTVIKPSKEELLNGDLQAVAIIEPLPVEHSLIKSAEPNFQALPANATEESNLLREDLKQVEIPQYLETTEQKNREEALDDSNLHQPSSLRLRKATDLLPQVVEKVNERKVLGDQLNQDQITSLCKMLLERVEGAEDVDLEKYGLKVETIKSLIDLISEVLRVNDFIYTEEQAHRLHSLIPHADYEPQLNQDQEDNMYFEANNGQENEEPHLSTNRIEGIPTVIEEEPGEYGSSYDALKQEKINIIVTPAQDDDQQQQEGGFSQQQDNYRPVIEQEAQDEYQEIASLYQRIGGEPAILAVVEGMYEKIFTDPDLEDFYKKTDKPHLKEMQKQFLTYAMGGQVDYHGKAMGLAHEGRGITSFEFDRVALHTVTTLQELSVPQHLINEVVAILLPLRSQIAEDCQSSKQNGAEISPKEESKSNEVYPQKELTHFEKLGGAPAIAAVVDGMYQRIFNDPDLKDFFAKTDKPHQKEMQRQFLTYATGGSTEWHGKTMSKAHHGRGIQEVHFFKTAEHVVATMKDLGVPDDLIQQVAALLMTLKNDCTDPPTEVK